MQRRSPDAATAAIAPPRTVAAPRTCVGSSRSPLLSTSPDLAMTHHRPSSVPLHGLHAPLPRRLTIHMAQHKAPWSVSHPY